MKSAGLTAIALAIALTGIYISDKRRRQAELMKKIALFFSQIAALCSTGEYSVAQIFNLLSSRRELQSLGFISYMTVHLSEGENVRDIWQQALTDSFLSGIDAEGRNMLLQFGYGFGRLSRDEFLFLCEKYNKEFTSRAQELKKSWEKSREAVVCSGVLAAAAVFFIFM